MTNEQLFDDLKQFIATTVSQSEERLRSEMATKEDLSAFATKEDLIAVEQRLGGKIDDVQKSVAEAMSLVNDDVDERLDDHKHRLQRLEHRHA